MHLELDSLSRRRPGRTRPPLRQLKTPQTRAEAAKKQPFLLRKGCESVIAYEHFVSINQERPPTSNGASKSARRARLDFSPIVHVLRNYGQTETSKSAAKRARYPMFCVRHRYHSKRDNQGKATVCWYRLWLNREAIAPVDRMSSMDRRYTISLAVPLRPKIRTSWRTATPVPARWKASHPRRPPLALHRL